MEEGRRVSAQGRGRHQAGSLRERGQEQFIPGETARQRAGSTHSHFTRVQHRQPRPGPATGDDQAGPDLGENQVGWDGEGAHRGPGRGGLCLTFDIAMQNPSGVEVLQPFQSLAQVVKGPVFWQTALLLYELAQRAT